MISGGMAVDALSGPGGRSLGPFHVHRGHAFDGVRIVDRDGRPLLEARCHCGDLLDVADASFSPCPECRATGRRDCMRCRGTGEIIDHAALAWRLPTARGAECGRAVTARRA